MAEEQKRKLALAFNARQTGLGKRIRKAVFKRFPTSALAEGMKRRALRFENLLIQKIACMRDACERFGADRFVFLDADAMVFKPIDDVFSDADDITITLISDPSWDHNACFVVNSGVIFFGADNRTRTAFLDAWWEAALNNYEWLREQSALVRMIEGQTDRKEFAVENRIRLDLSDVPVRIRFLACDEYNFFQMENVDPRDFPDSRIYHFTGRRQQPKEFHEIMAYLRARRSETAPI